VHYNRGSHMISYGVIKYGIELDWSILEEYYRLEEKYLLLHMF